MKFEFASLTPHEALHLAILIEERNARLYESFARLFDEFMDEESQKVAAAFRAMASEEHRHGKVLQERYAERYGIRLSHLTEDDLLDVIEFPQLPDDALFDPEGFDRRQALEVALAAEPHARSYYTRLSELTHDPQLRQLYSELAAFERDHEQFLEQKLAQKVFVREEE